MIMRWIRYARRQTRVEAGDSGLHSFTMPYQGIKSMTSLNRKELGQFLFVLLLAAALRFYNLGYASLWLDEAETIRISGFPWSRLWITDYDNTPPLYYSVIHFVLKSGHSEFLLRLPSAAFGVLSIAIMYLATRKISGSTAALITALILSLSFHNIEYSQEARAYSLLGLCLSVSILGLTMLSVRWNESGSGFTFFEFIRSGGGLYALGLISALYTHNIAVFYWLGVQIFFLAWWVRPFRFSLPCLVSWSAVNLVVLLLWMPWLNVILQLIERGTFSWLEQAEPERAVCPLFGNCAGCEPAYFHLQHSGPFRDRHVRGNHGGSCQGP